MKLSNVGQYLIIIEQSVMYCVFKRRIRQKMTKAYGVQNGVAIFNFPMELVVREVLQSVVKKQSNCVISCPMTDMEGREVSCDVKEGEHEFRLVNLYGPNNDTPTFYDTRINKQYEQSEKVVFVGDFNAVMCHELDRRAENTQPINPRTTEKLNQLCETLQLQDVWRVRNPEKKRYSWYRRKDRASIQASRIDYALTSISVSNAVHDTFYMNGLMTDHSAFFIGIDLMPIERGPSFWKLNTTLLYEKGVIEEIRATINRVKSDYIHVSPKIKWEKVKNEIRTVCKKASKKVASEDSIAASQLAEHITEAENNLVINRRADQHVRTI